MRWKRHIETPASFLIRYTLSPLVKRYWRPLTGGNGSLVNIQHVWVFSKALFSALLPFSHSDNSVAGQKFTFYRVTLNLPASVCLYQIRFTVWRQLCTATRFDQSSLTPHNLMPASDNKWRIHLHILSWLNLSASYRPAMSHRDWEPRMQIACAGDLMCGQRMVPSFARVPTDRWKHISGSQLIVASLRH